MERKQLGKIKSAKFGFGGYQDAMIGATFDLGGEGWGVMDFWGCWSGARTDRTKWSETDRRDALGGVVMRLAALLTDAKVQHVAELAGVPVEVTFDGTMLKSWRVLTEVI